MPGDRGGRAWRKMMADECTDLVAGAAGDAGSALLKKNLSAVSEPWHAEPVAMATGTQQARC